MNSRWQLLHRMGKHLAMVRCSAVFHSRFDIAQVRVRNTKTLAQLEAEMQQMQLAQVRNR